MAGNTNWYFRELGSLRGWTWGEWLSRFIKSSSITVHTFLGRNAVGKTILELTRE